jgi:hypothetical protein
MGSITQVLVPTGIAVHFWFGRRDRLAAGLCLAWTGTSARDAAVYIADAPYQRLTLIGGEHDWAFVLGPAHLNLLNRAGLIAALVTALAVLLVLAGFAAYASGLFSRERRSGPTPHTQYGFGERRPPIASLARSVGLAEHDGVRYPPHAMQ